MELVIWQAIILSTLTFFLGCMITNEIKKGLSRRDLHKKAYLYYQALKVKCQNPEELVEVYTLALDTLYNTNHTDELKTKMIADMRIDMAME